MTHIRITDSTTHTNHEFNHSTIHKFIRRITNQKFTRTSIKIYKNRYIGSLPESQTASTSPMVTTRSQPHPSGRCSRPRALSCSWPRPPLGRPQLPTACAAPSWLPLSSPVAPCRAALALAYRLVPAGHSGLRRPVDLCVGDRIEGVNR
jgi:hypothetical protein